MGLGGISMWQLLIVLAIVLLVFGTKRIRNLGGDLGGAIKGFKSAMNDGEKEQDAAQQSEALEGEDAPKAQAEDKADDKTKQTTGSPK